MAEMPDRFYGLSRLEGMPGEGRVMRDVLIFVVALLLLAAVYIWFLRALYRVVLNRKHWDTYLWVAGVLLASMFFYVPTALAGAPDWSIFVTSAVLLGYSLWQIVTTILFRSRSEPPDRGTAGGPG